MLSVNWFGRSYLAARVINADAVFVTCVTPPGTATEPLRVLVWPAATSNVPLKLAAEDPLIWNS